MIWTDAARLVVGAAVLTFAAWTDLRWRRAPDTSWWVAGGAGLALLAVDALTDGAWVRLNIAAIIIAGTMGALALLGYRFGLLMGGADAKALVAFAALGALPLGLQASTLLPPSPFPLVMSMLGNALIVAPLIPLGFLLFNVLRRDGVMPMALIGYRRAVQGLDNAPVWSLEWVDEEGEVRRSGSLRRVPYDASRERVLAGAGAERVWVTPKIPFLVPLALGYVSAFFVGDILGSLVALAMD